MKGIKEAFIDAGEISQMLGIGMTKAYAIIKEYNAELEAKGYFTMRGKCPRKYFEQKIYGYEDYYNPDYEPQRNRSKVVEEMDYEAAVGDSVISEQDEVDIPPETNELSEDGAEIAENVMLDADVMVKETTESCGYGFKAIRKGFERSIPTGYFCWIYRYSYCRDLSDFW